MPDASDLIARAHRTRVIVVGGGPAGEVAALECAKVGMSVTLLEASDRLGGALRDVDLDGVHVDAVVDSFSAEAPEFDALLGELGLDHAIRGARPASARPAGAWVQGSWGTAPLPDDALIGIPANPWDPRVRRIIGWRGAWRAYLDRLRPPLTIGHERNLGALVRSRMGDRVCERMVAPVTRAMLGAEPEEIDVEAVAPGLGTALTRAGSLAGAVASSGGTAHARRTLEGGLAQVSTALAERLALLEVDVRTGVRVGGISRSATGWSVEIAPVIDPELAPATASGDESQTAAAVPDAPEGNAPENTLEADVLVIAIDEAAARKLLSTQIDLPQSSHSRRAEVHGVDVHGAEMHGAEVHWVDVVTLRVGMPDPGRAAVYPGDAGAVRSVADLTATGAVHAGELAAGERVLRVVLEATVRSDETVIDAARQAVSDAFGSTVVPSEVRAAARTRTAWAPIGAIGQEAYETQLRRAVHAADALAVTGGWLAGGEIGAIVADATAEAARVRGGVLWDDESAVT